MATEHEKTQHYQTYKPEVDLLEVYRERVAELEARVTDLQRLVAVLLEMAGGEVAVPDWVLYSSTLLAWRDERKPGLVLKVTR